MAVTEHANLTYHNVTYCNITCEGAFMYVCSVGKNVAVCAKLQLNCKSVCVCLFIHNWLHLPFRRPWHGIWLYMGWTLMTGCFMYSYSLLLRTLSYPFSWDVMPCHWLIGSWHFKISVLSEFIRNQFHSNVMLYHVWVDTSAALLWKPKPLTSSKHYQLLWRQRVSKIWTKPICFYI